MSNEMAPIPANGLTFNGRTVSIHKITGAILSLGDVAKSLGVAYAETDATGKQKKTAAFTELQTIYNGMKAKAVQNNSVTLGALVGSGSFETPRLTFNAKTGSYSATLRPKQAPKALSMPKAVKALTVEQLEALLASKRAETSKPATV